MGVNEESQENESVHEEFRRVDTSQTQPSLEYGKKNGASKPLLLLLGLIVLLTIGATGYLLKDKFTSPEPTPTPEQSGKLETPITQPSPTPSFDRSKYTLRILNGTKTSGLAASVSATLKDLGYGVDKTGNATNSAFTTTRIRLKGDISGLLEQLIKDLSPDYDAKESTPLKDSDSVDVEIILGAE